MSSRRRMPVTGNDDGFSLVEAVVALTIATVVFTALAFALIGGVKSALLSQQNQQAADVLNKAVETARALPYSQLAMRPADLDASDARTPSISSCLCYNATLNTTSGAGVEPLVAPDVNGGLSPHVSQVSQNGGTFTVRRYVTVPTDASGAVYKRLTVVVEWTSLGKQRTRKYSTLVAETKRGLPLPDFKFTNAGSLAQCRNPGSTAVYGFTLKNNGARDNWQFTTSPATPTWSYYSDTNGNGAYDAGADLALPNTAGVPSTGLLEPTSSATFFAVQGLNAVTSPSTLTTVFRATSVAQPDYYQELTAVTSVQDGPCGSTAVSPTASPTATASATPAPTAPVQPPASCASLTGPATTSAPGGTMVRYYPTNPAQPGDTTAATNMPVRRDSGSPPSVGDLYNYSTDLHSAAGRYLAPGTGSGADQVATWVYGMPAASTLKGDGEATLYAMPADGSSAARPVFTVTLELVRASGTTTTLGSATYTTPSSGWGCSGMRPVSLSFLDATGSGISVAANDVLRLRVRVSGVPVRLAYGTAAYPMTFTLPYKSGLG